MLKKLCSKKPMLFPSPIIQINNPLGLLLLKTQHSNLVVVLLKTRPPQNNRPPDQQADGRGKVKPGGKRVPFSVFFFFKAPKLPCRRRRTWKSSVESVRAGGHGRPRVRVTYLLPPLPLARGCWEVCGWGFDL